MEPEYLFYQRTFGQGKYLPVILVHGAGWKRASDFLSFLQPHVDRFLKINTILIVPGYRAPYQFLVPDLDRKLLKEISRYIGNRRDVHKKLCLYGFSAGAQFVHRFTYIHPEKVACCAAFAAGSWNLPDGKLIGFHTGSGKFSRRPFILPDVKKKMGMKARPGIEKVRWVLGSGKQDPRYESSRDFYKSLVSTGAEASFYGYNKAHAVNSEVFKRTFRAFIQSARSS